jgi:hypothetical protein
VSCPLAAAMMCQVVSGRRGRQAIETSDRDVVRAGLMPHRMEPGTGAVDLMGRESLQTGTMGRGNPQTGLVRIGNSLIALAETGSRQIALVGRESPRNALVEIESPRTAQRTENHAESVL